MRPKADVLHALNCNEACHVEFSKERPHEQGLFMLNEAMVFTSLPTETTFNEILF